MKGDLDRIGELAGGFAWQAGGPEWLASSRAARISLAGGKSEALGFAGQLARRTAEQLKLRQDVYVVELKLEPFLVGIEAARAALRFVALPRYPAVERDFSLVLADGVTFAQVAETIRALGIAEIRDIQAGDRLTYEEMRKLVGKDFEPELAKVFKPGTYTLMIRVKFQSAQATFTDAQLADFTSGIVIALEQTLGATLRAS